MRGITREEYLRLQGLTLGDDVMDDMYLWDRNNDLVARGCAVWVSFGYMDKDGCDGAWHQHGGLDSDLPVRTLPRGAAMNVLKASKTDCCFYACVVIGHFPNRKETLAFWEIPDTLQPVTPGKGKMVVWSKIESDDRSILRHIVALGLFKSGGEVRRNRPDLAQSFGSDDRGLFTAVVGRTLVEFIVGWPTAEEAALFS